MNHLRLFRSVRHRPGVTLIEVAVSTVLVGVVLVASLETIGSALRTARSSEDASNGQTLAENLLVEAMAMPTEDPDGSALFGIEGDETSSPSNRSEFDDLDDYDSWTKSPPQSKDGASVGSLAAWTRSVSVTLVDDTNSDFYGLREVVVTATHSNGESYQLSSLRSKHSAVDQSPTVDTTMSTMVLGVISFGNGDFVYRTAPNNNQALEP